MLTWRFVRPMAASTCGERASTAGAGEYEEDPALRAPVAELRATLAPVTPRESFRRELGRELVAVARQRTSPRIILQEPRNYRRGLLIGAAAVSSAVSVAGLVALLWRHRAQETSAVHG